MANWVLKGLRTGIKTTAYPQRRRRQPVGLSPGRPLGKPWDPPEQADELAERCPTGAIERHDGGIAIDAGTLRSLLPLPSRRRRTCRRPGRWATNGAPMPMKWRCARRKLDAVFGRSLHIRFVDAGACGACMSEARQLNNPYYNMHRLGFFITPTPRNADVLLVAGPVSDAMRTPLRKT